MQSLELVRTNFCEFIQTILPNINAGDYADCITFFSVDHLACELTHLVITYPESTIGRCLPDIWSPAQNLDWLSKASFLLNNEKSMQIELKLNGVKKINMPTWLLSFHGSDRYANPELDLGYRCTSVMIPSGQVLPVFEFYSRWLNQLSEYTFLAYPEEQIIVGSDLISAVGTDYDLLCFPFLREKIFGRWHGEFGLLPRLQRKVAEIEAGGNKSLDMPPLYLTHSASLSSGRDIFFSKHTKHWVDEFALENGDPNRPMNLEVLDLIFCLQCRLVRLLEWPQNYTNAKTNLEKEQAFTATHPMTQGLPYDPYAELSEYLSLMRQRYPILEESPYTADAFSKPPVAR